jgi:hypothetical protein
MSMSKRHVWNELVWSRLAVETLSATDTMRVPLRNGKHMCLFISNNAVQPNLVQIQCLELQHLEDMRNSLLYPLQHGALLG